MVLKRSENVPWLLIFACCSSALATAYIAEYGFDIKPCPLCLYHRYAYYFIGGWAALTALTPLRKPGSWLVLTGCFAGMGIAFYHIAIENHWYRLTEACQGGKLVGNSLAEIKQHLLNNTDVGCAPDAWSFLGVSFTVYSFLLFLGLTGFTIATLFIESKMKGVKNA